MQFMSEGLEMPRLQEGDHNYFDALQVYINVESAHKVVIIVESRPLVALRTLYIHWHWR